MVSRVDEPTREQIVVGLMAYGTSREDAEHAADRKLGLLSVRVDPRMPTGIVTLRRRDAIVGAATGSLNALEHFYRRGDTLELRLVLPPRTKKNGTTLGIRQSAGYRRYRDAIIAAIAPVKSLIGLPLPDREYNIAATYYVDRRGERADKCGLDQGLYDALENAGVVTNDWFFRTDDGTRIIAGDPRPRVELTITPIQPSEA